MSSGAQVYRGSRNGLGEQLYLKLDGCTGLNPKRRKEEDPARTDVCRLQEVSLRVALSGYPL